MSRKAREKSETGIYHIMLRGINRQNIFEDDQEIQGFEKAKRNEIISNLKMNEDLSIRQMARITGLSRKIVKISRDNTPVLLSQSLCIF